MKPPRCSRRDFLSRSLLATAAAARFQETPQQTLDSMSEIEKPWIAYKVLGAGAIHPTEGFRYAFNNGADFICAGMFDFQIDEDVQIAQAAVRAANNRDRPWCA